MKYYRYERQEDMSLKDWLFYFLESKQIEQDCIVTCSLVREVDGEDHINSIMNVYVHCLGKYSGDTIKYDCLDFEVFKQDSILYIYGYTFINEVIMRRGVT